MSRYYRSFLEESGAVYTARTTAFASATAITDTTILNALNTFDLGLISNGLDTKMKALYPFVGGTATTHKYNFMNALDTNAAFRLAFNGGWTHNSNGITGSTNAYADTYLNPTISLTVTTPHVSYYNRSTVSDSGVWIGTNSFNLFLQNLSGTLYGCISNGNYMSAASGSQNQFFMVNRYNFGLQELRKNSSSLTSNSTGSNGFNNHNIILNAYSTSSSFSNGNCAFSSIGDGLTNSEASTFYNLVQAMQTSLARQI